MNKKSFLLGLLKSQVKPALGCTEIGIVSLAAAKASSLLKNKIKNVEIIVSPYVMRNDARVGVPNLGRCGIKTIAAAGILLKNPEKKLSILDDVNSKNIKEVKKLGKSNIFHVKVDYKSHPVFTRVIATDCKSNIADVTIAFVHDNIISAKLNKKETISKNKKCHNCGSEFDYDKNVNFLSLVDAYSICKKLSIKDVKFLKQGIDLNKKVCNEGLKNPDSTSISKIWQKMLRNSSCSFGFTKKHWTAEMLGYVCSAVDARMYGCPLPVMTSANSGDHGLTVIIPQSIHARYFNISKLKMLQSTAFAHFVTWKIKSKIGHLCGMCGSAIGAGAGAICGIALQRNWSWKSINDLLNMHLITQSGVVCDGAKPSCSLKILSSLVSGFLCLSIAENKGKLCNYDGFVNDNVEKTIDNLGKFSKNTQSTIVKTTVDILSEINK